MKQIVVPIDKEAQHRLDYGEETDFDLISVYLNQADFDALWDIPLYSETNETLDLLIDDFEEEEITGKFNLQKFHEIIVKHEKSNNIPILYTLKSLTEAAIRFDTGVYFFF